MSKLSVVVSAYNESHKIGRCLTSVQFADEIVVIDNQSSDDTAAIAKKHHARVYSQPNRLMLNLNKNFGFSKATGDWILNLDADEEVTLALKAEIINIISHNQSVDGYWIPRKNIIFGKWIKHGIWWPDKQLRLFRRGKGKFNCQKISEYVRIDGKVGEIIEPYIHYNYESVSQYLNKIDRCTTSESQEYLTGGYQFVWYDAIRFPASDFIKVYFAQEAYLDGLHGLVLSLLQAFYTFVIFSKIWEKDHFPEHDTPLSVITSEFEYTHNELKYWQISAYLKTSPTLLQSLWFKLTRRLIRWKI